MPRILWSLLAIVAALPAAAQERGDAEAGHQLSSKLCTACHIVGDERSGSDLAPPFRQIAKDPNTSLIELHSWGQSGHPTLRHLALTSKQAADIDAYLDSLRGAAPTPAPAAQRTLPQAPPDKIGPPIGSQ
jgi:mono/diheme cytochrome c family protein